MKFRNQMKWLFSIAVFSLMAVLAMAGCHQHENTLQAFFFPDEETEAAAQPAKPDEITVPEKEIVDEEQHYLLVTHKPYLERKCVECHEGASAFSTSILGENWDGIFRKGGGKPGPLTLPVRELCLKCHKDMTVEWAKERGLYLHKTAAEGDCVKCHVPHQGRHPYRLVVDKDQLCFYKCHNANDKTGIPRCVTELKVTGPCLSCHNAHLGISKPLLKKDYEEPKHRVSEETGASGENVSPADKEKGE